MKRTLLLLSLGAFLATPAFAQPAGTNSPANTPPPPPHAPGGPPPEGSHMAGGLTFDERQELMTARKTALQANPELVQEQKALQDKINAAMIKVDPKVAPIIAKMEAAHSHHDGPGGPPPEHPGDKPKPPPPPQ